MIVTITGANDLLRRRELDKLVGAFIKKHTDMAVERFDGEEDDAAAMRGALASMPFLTPRKLVVLREPGKQKQFAEAIADILKEVADTTDVIIYEPKLDKRFGYYKTLKKETDFKEFNTVDAHGLAEWAAEYAKELGGSLKPADARFLVERAGTGHMGLKNELDKLLAYDPAVTREAIELLCEPLPQSTVFELLDAAFNGNAVKAITLYKEQRALKVEPQEIIALLAWQLHALATIAAGAGKPPDEIARAAKLNPFVVRKSQSLAKRLGLARIRQLVRDLSELDRQLKRAPLDADEALQLYLLKITRA